MLETKKQSASQASIQNNLCCNGTAWAILDAIGDVERGNKLTNVAAKSGVSKHTLSIIVKAKNRLRKKATDFTQDQKPLCKGDFPQQERALVIWYMISGPLLWEQGLALALRMNLDDYTASGRWIGKFKKRHGLGVKTVNGESADVNTDITKSWQETHLKDILGNYQPADRCDADKCRLVFKCLPNKTLWPCNRRRLGGKSSKERLIVLVCTLWAAVISWLF